MYILDHKPALCLALSSMASYAVHASTPFVDTPVSMFDSLERWVHLLGGVSAILAGLASTAWYLYSFYSAHQKSKKP
jgi:hypothetical protein